VVFDPFMGGGSLGHACHETGRGFIGSEKCPSNFVMALNRIEQSQSQSMMFA
jgi:DNA modification methylase